MLTLLNITIIIHDLIQQCVIYSKLLTLIHNLHALLVYIYEARSYNTLTDLGWGKMVIL